METNGKRKTVDKKKIKAWARKRQQQCPEKYNSLKVVIYFFN